MKRGSSKHGPQPPPGVCGRCGKPAVSTRSLCVRCHLEDTDPDAAAIYDMTCDEAIDYFKRKARSAREAGA